jgi:hypothetical protein
MNETQRTQQTGNATGALSQHLVHLLAGAGAGLAGLSAVWPAGPARVAPTRTGCRLPIFFNAAANHPCVVRVRSKRSCPEVISRLRDGSQVTSAGIRACFEIRRGPVFGEKDGWRGATREHPRPAERDDRGATKPDGLLRENPPGGESFARGLRRLVPYSPLRGCSELASLSTAKILRRRPLPISNQALKGARFGF